MPQVAVAVEAAAPTASANPSFKQKRRHSRKSVLSPEQQREFSPPPQRNVPELRPPLPEGARRASALAEPLPSDAGAGPSDPSAYGEAAAAAAVATLRERAAESTACELAAEALLALCFAENRAAAAAAGALEQAVAAMRAHTQAARIQVLGCSIVFNVMGGAELDADPRRQRAAEAGALEAAVSAMRTHPVTAVLIEACSVLFNICVGRDAAVRTRRARAAEAGAVEAVCAAMRAHKAEALVQERGCAVLTQMCIGGDDAAGRARIVKRASHAGAEAALSAAVELHDDHALVVLQGGALLEAIRAVATPPAERWHPHGEGHRERRVSKEVLEPGARRKRSTSNERAGGSAAAAAAAAHAPGAAGPSGARPGWKSR